MAWIVRKRFALLAYAIFFLPALVIPAFIHEQSHMRAAVYLAWVFATPLAALVGLLSHKRTLLFYLGIGATLLPVEVVWYFAYQYTAFNPPHEIVAEWYIPIIIFSALFGMPVGFWLTYAGTRGEQSRDGARRGSG